MTGPLLPIGPRPGPEGTPRIDPVPRTERKERRPRDEEPRERKKQPPPYGGAAVPDEDGHIDVLA